MKIKSIAAAVAAAGTVCAVSATAFAEDVVLVSAPVTEDIYVSPDDASAELETKVAEQFNKLFGDQLEVFAQQIKAAIEAAGGVEAVVNSAMEQIEGKTPDELKAMFVEQLKASNISEEQINLIMQQYDSESGEGSFTADTYKQIMTDILNTLQSAEGAGSFIETILMNCDEETLKQLSEAFDAYEAGEVEDDKTGEGETTGEATGGDNADTGVEGVAAVVGVIAVAGAVVVISRKRA
ncbi:MAG: NPXTG-anchored protein [Oscillospiraceae bacterium]|nr:NPXTG-anchored protein [Oscillospiraceae bacterium]